MNKRDARTDTLMTVVNFEELITPSLWKGISTKLPRRISSPEGGEEVGSFHCQVAFIGGLTPRSSGFDFVLTTKPKKFLHTVHS